jgi:hypothetical protein
MYSVDEQGSASGCIMFVALPDRNLTTNWQNDHTIYHAFMINRKL